MFERLIVLSCQFVISARQEMMFTKLFLDKEMDDGGYF